MSSLTDESVPEGVLKEYQWSVVVTQDCDLEQDARIRFSTEERGTSQDKLLFGMILCGAYPEAKLKAGAHRSGAKSFGSKEWKSVEKNLEPRYQNLGWVPGVGLLVADFKDYFMVPAEFLYSEVGVGAIKRIAELDSPYRDHLMQRFAWYIMRIGLQVNFEDLPSGAALSPRLAAEDELPVDEQK